MAYLRKILTDRLKKIFLLEVVLILILNRFYLYVFSEKLIIEKIIVVGRTYL